MAGFKYSGESELISDINVTPFVDVILVLLIIFMSTSTVILRTALDLDIPGAANSDKKKSKPIWSVVINADKSLVVNGESTTESELFRRLRTEASIRNKEKTKVAEPMQVLISAAGGHRYQEVVHVIDLIKGAGVEQVALNTKLEGDENATGNHDGNNDE